MRSRNYTIRRRTRLSAIAAAALGAAICAAPLRGQQPAPTTATAAPTASPFARNDLASIVGVLRAPNQSASTNERDEAARRLVDASTPEGLDALNGTLQSIGNPAAQRSVARALIDTANPDQRFIVPLGALLSQDVSLAQPAAQALANYRGNDDALTRLITAAQNPQLKDDVRSVVIRAMATLTEKRAAKALIDIVASANESATVRNTAADALAQMTGVTESGRDAALWQKWWSANAQRPDAQFAADIGAARAAQLERQRLANDRLTDGMQPLLSSLYRNSAKKSDTLVQYLTNPAPAVRKIGAEIVLEEAREAQQISPAVREQLRRLVGDSSASVRLEVARAIRQLNETPAADAMLAQLSRERNNGVRALIASTLATMGDPRAVDAFLQMLQTDDAATIRVAADALGEYAAKLGPSDPVTAKRISAAINDRRQQLAGAPLDLRNALVDAMGRYGNPDLRNEFNDLLIPGEAPETRMLAIQGLGMMHTDWAADIIAQSDVLTDPNSKVRLAAVQAMRDTNALAYVDRIADRLNDSDALVRGVAWKALITLFADPRFDATALAMYDNRFKDQPERRIAVLEEMKKRLANKPADLAVVEQNMGDAQLRLNKYGDAAANFQAALDYYVKAGVNLAIAEGLVSQLLDAYLLNNEYVKATDFASKWMRENPSLKLELGSKLVAAVERLKRAEQYETAIKLGDQVETIVEILPPANQNDIKRLHDDLRSALARQNGGKSMLDPSRQASDRPPFDLRENEPFAMAE